MNDSERKEKCRREFISACAAGIASLGLTGLVLTTLGFESRADEPNVLATVPIQQYPGLQQIGGYTIVKKTPVGDLLITHSAGSEYTAMSTVCPHLQCNVKVKSPSIIQCPCHQSAYKIDGSYINGPAKAGLKKFPVVVDSGVIKVLNA